MKRPTNIGWQANPLLLMDSNGSDRSWMTRKFVTLPPDRLDKSTATFTRSGKFLTEFADEYIDNPDFWNFFKTFNVHPTEKRFFCHQPTT